MALPSNLIRHWHVNSGLYKDAGVTSASVGDAVQEWHDVVGGHVASQVTLSSQPLLQPTGVHFDKTKILEGASINLGSGAKTLVVLAKHNTSTSYGVVADINSSTTPNSSFNIFLGNGDFRSYTNGTNSNRSFIEEWHYSADTTAYSIAALAYPANPTGIGNAYLNGNVLTVDDPGKTPNNIDGTGTLSIGGNSVLSSTFLWDGDIKAVAVWDVELTATEIAAITEADLVPPPAPKALPQRDNLKRWWHTNFGLFKDDLQTLAVENDQVDAWYDAITKDKIEQPNPTHRPELQSDGVYFDNNAWLFNNASLVLGNGARTLIALVKRDTSISGANNIFTLNINDFATRGESYALTSESAVRVSSGNRIFGNNPVSGTDFDVLVVTNPNSASTSNLRAFINGVELTATSTGTESIDTKNNGFMMGRAFEQSSSGPNFAGWIKAVALWDVELTPTEIANIHPVDLTPTYELPATTNLIHHWTYKEKVFSDTSNTQAEDTDSVVEWQDIIGDKIVSQSPASTNTPTLSTSSGVYFDGDDFLEGSGVNLGTSARRHI